ncbi:hypothetical protein [Kitasatospora sp. NPDC054795]
MTARFARRGDTRWKGFLAHVTETCDEGAVNVIADVTTTNAVIHDSKTRRPHRGTRPHRAASAGVPVSEGRS